MRSLTARLLLAASGVLFAFLGLTGWTLDHAFQRSAEAALRERLDARLYTLLAAAEPDARGMVHLPETLPDARFSQPGSGLYAVVLDQSGKPLWRSASLLGQTLALPGTQPEGERAFDRIESSRGGAIYALSFGVSWESSAGKARHYTFQIAEGLAGLEAEVLGFRRSLWGWLGALALGLLLAQAVILRWTLAPLRRVAAEVAAIEAGVKPRLEGEYPYELAALTSNLNALLKSEREQLARYRNGLADLAHSLKTPLAVLRGAVQEQPQPSPTLQEQVERMTQIVGYQLQRAAASGRSSLMAPVEIQPLLQRLISALDKVYAGKGVRGEHTVSIGLSFHGDESDLMELSGNLLDNAYKWCMREVRVTASREVESNGPVLRIVVEDDGPGIPPTAAQGMFTRGVRADERVEGQGIGLTVAHDIVRLYGGTLSIGASARGGAAFTVTLPERAQT
jgi:two-component system sensor histidine kinase PhoQ